MKEKQISMFDTGVLYDTGEKKRPCDYSFVREVGMKVRRWRTGEIAEITEILPYYTYLSDGTVATPCDIAPWDENDRLIRIPEDIWKNRCAFCVHREAKENWPFPVSQINRNTIKPCKIIRFFKSEKPGECRSFQPEWGTGGICYSCRYNNRFAEDFCTKEGHAPQRRVYEADGFPGDEKHRDYWGRHIQCVCDDYEPYKEGIRYLEAHTNGEN